MNKWLCIDLYRLSEGGVEPRQLPGYLMWEMQEGFLLKLFMFASQLYFYILGPSSLLGY